MPSSFTSPIVPQLLNDKDAATWLGICPRSLWGLRVSGEIPYVKIKRSIRYDIKDLKAYVERNKRRRDSE